MIRFSLASSAREKVECASGKKSVVHAKLKKRPLQESLSNPIKDEESLLFGWEHCWNPRKVQGLRIKRACKINNDKMPRVGRGTETQGFPH